METAKRAQRAKGGAKGTLLVERGVGARGLQSSLECGRAHRSQHALDVGRIEPFGHQRCGIQAAIHMRFQQSIERRVIDAHALLVFLVG